MDFTRNTKIDISSILMINNTAISGGGMFIILNDNGQISFSSFTVTLMNSNFSLNYAKLDSSPNLTQEIFTLLSG